MFTGKHVLRRQKYTCTWTPSKSPRVVNNTVVDRDSLYRHWIEKSPPTAKYNYQVITCRQPSIYLFHGMVFG